MIRKFLVIALISIALNAAACPDDKMCQACTGSKCTLCHGGYLNTDFICTKPDTEVSDCATYLTATTCGACEPGYNLKDNKCTKIDIANCAALNPIDTTQCIICDNGTQVKSGKCDGDVKCTTENCSMCALDICGECKSGYSLDATFKCVKEPYSGCGFVGTDATTCDACNHGYYDAGTECKKTAKIFGIIALFVSALIMA